jgi:hypothetical protein
MRVSAFLGAIAVAATFLVAALVAHGSNLGGWEETVLWAGAGLGGLAAAVLPVWMKPDAKMANVASINGSVQGSVIAPGNSGNITVGGSTPAVPNEWWLRPGAPRFETRMNVEHRDPSDRGSFVVERKLRVHGGPPGAIRWRYRGSGAAQNWQDAQLDGTNEFKASVAFHPDLSEGSSEVAAGRLGLELSFWWDGGQRTELTSWPLRQNSKGHWILDTHVPQIIHC